MMNKLFTSYLGLLGYFLFLSATSHAEETRLAPEAEPLALVHGCVNVVTGNLVQQEADLIVEGPSPLSYTRVYDSGMSNAGSSLGYGFTPGLARSINITGTDRHHSYASMQEREGVGLAYTGTAAHYTIDSKVFTKGYTNYSHHGISGANDLHNVKLVQIGHGGHYKGGAFEVTLGCGTKRHYHCREGRGCTGWEFDIVAETRPDGNRVCYKYTGDVLTQVYLTSAEEDTPLISYTFAHVGSNSIVSGSNGKIVRYIKDINKQREMDPERGLVRRKTTRLARVEADHLPMIAYDYPEEVTPRTRGNIAKISHPDGRALHIHYYPSGRVKALLAPVGSNGNLSNVAEFNYYPDKGFVNPSDPDYLESQ